MDIKENINRDVKKAISTFKASAKDKFAVDKLRKEFKNLDRKLRNTQIDNIQRHKIIGKGEKQKLVLASRITIPFQNRVVNIATAFEVGEPVTITPNKPTALSEEILRLWITNRLDSKLQDLIITKKSETETAIMFYIDNLEDKKWYNYLLGKNINLEIKSKILEQDKGKFYPYFDSFGDMQAFVWEFSETDIDNKTINNTWVFDKQNIYKIKNGDSNAIADIDIVSHGFTVIPIVYMSQNEPEWHEVQTMIDRLEVAMSKLAGSNDRTAHPILRVYGEILGDMDKDDDGKVMKFPMKEIQDTPGKFMHGDADYLTNPNAPESSKLELDKLEAFIYTLSSTPNLSFDNLKGLGDVSGVALKLMFLDAIIKAKMNEGDNRTAIQRMLNILISGTINKTNVAMKTQAKDLLFTIQFNSILPNDLSETVTYLSQAVAGNIVSRKTAVDMLDLTEDNEQELKDIESVKQPAPEV